MPLSDIAVLVRNLITVPAVVLRSRVAKDAEVLALRHENAVLRRQIARARYKPADRIWLAALSRLIPRDRWRQVFPVTPTTLLRWHLQLIAPHLERAPSPHALHEFEQHHNAHRPHQALNQAAPLHAVPEPITDPGRIASLDIRRHDRLEGVIHEYQHAA